MSTCDCTDRCPDCADRPMCCFCHTDQVTRKWDIDCALDDDDVDSTDDLPFLM